MGIVLESQLQFVWTCQWCRRRCSWCVLWVGQVAASQELGGRRGAWDWSFSERSLQDVSVWHRFSGLRTRIRGVRRGPCTLLRRVIQHEAKGAARELCGLSCRRARWLTAGLKGHASHLQREVTATTKFVRVFLGYISIAVNFSWPQSSMISFCAVCSSLQSHNSKGYGLKMTERP